MTLKFKLGKNNQNNTNIDYETLTIKFGSEKRPHDKLKRKYQIGKFNHQ